MHRGVRAASAAIGLGLLATEGWLAINLLRQQRRLTRRLRDLERRIAPEVGDPIGWWVRKTAVPWEFWLHLGVMAADDGSLAFVWRGAPGVRKLRRPGDERIYRWEPDGAAMPWLWPDVPPHLPAEVWLAEGESDAGVLRFAALEAFSTGGPLLLPPAAVFQELRRRGARTLVLVYDADQAGASGAQTLARAADLAGLVTRIVTPQVDVLLGQKDVNDLWHQVGYDKDRLRRLLGATDLALSRGGPDITT